MTVMYRKTECKGCGYVQETTLSYYADRKMWEKNHTLDSCRSRKAFNELLGNPLEKLATLGVSFR